MIARSLLLSAIAVVAGSLAIGAVAQEIVLPQAEAPRIAAPEATPPAPEIVLPRSVTAPLADSPSAETRQVEVAPLAKPPAASLPDEVADAKPGQDDAADPPLRDTPLPAETPVAADWLIPITPQIDGQPGEVRIGASLPSPGLLRLTGEQASVDLDLFLPALAALPSDLVLAVRSSVNITPDGSTMKVQVNDAAPFTAPLNNVAGFGSVNVPATGLVAGQNHIRISVTQPHRIFCGPDASFGVWTEIDLTESGLPVAPSDLPLDAGGFTSALRSQMAQGAQISILAEPGTNPTILRQIAAAISDSIGTEAPAFDVRPFYETGNEGRARVALIASEQSGAAFRRASDGTIVLQIGLAGGKLPDLAAYLPRQPIIAKKLPEVIPGKVVTLADLGQPGFVANTHYFRRDIAFRLPDDWLLLANQKANLTLHYGFAADLTTGSILLVKVNGQSVQLLPLDKDGGEVKPPLDIRFPASLLHPGGNTLTFEMMVPGDPPDAACVVRKVDMLAVLGDTALSIPTAPRMMLPGLSTALASLSGANVVVPAAAPGRDLLETQILPFVTLLKPDDEVSGSAVLNVVRADGADLVPLAKLGVPWRMIQNAVLPTTLVLGNTEAGPMPTLEYKLSEKGAAAEQPVDSAPGMFSGFWSAIRQAVSSEGWTARQVLAIEHSAYLYHDGALSNWLAGKSGMAILLRPDPARPDDLWLVASPTADMTGVAQAVERLRDSALAHGDAALLQSDGAWLVWSDLVPPQMVEPLTLANMRGALGNYASWSPLLFAAVMLGLALLSALPALVYIRVTRQHGGGL